MGRPKKSDTPAKEKILSTASELFFQQGYHQTGTNQIIEEAGVSKPTFYANFPKKEHLGIAYVKNSAASSMHFLTARLHERKDPHQRYLSFFEGVRDFIISTHFRGCNFTNIAREFPDPEAPIRQEVIRFENDYRDLLKSVIEDLVESQPEHFYALGLSVSEIADRYYLLLEGAITAAANFNDTWPLDVAGKAINDLVKYPNLVKS